jgi:hypothetical protein
MGQGDPRRRHRAAVSVSDYIAFLSRLRGRWRATQVKMTDPAKPAALIALVQRVVHVVPITWLLATAVNAGTIDVVLGRLTHSNAYVSQIIAATNNTGYSIRALKLQCVFYRNSALLAIGRAFADNISNGQTVYVEVGVDALTDAIASRVNRAECNVVDTIWEE